MFWTLVLIVGSHYTKHFEFRSQAKCDEAVAEIQASEGAKFAVD